MEAYSKIAETFLKYNKPEELARLRDEGKLATFLTGIDEEKIKGYVDNLVKANLVSLTENTMTIKGVSDLDDYLRYIALKEKFERIL